MSDGLEVVAIALQRGGLHLGVEILGERLADLALDDQPRLTVGYSEKARQPLLGGDGIAVTRRRRRMRGARDQLAVDEHAVAIEDDEIEPALPVSPLLRTRA